jgi:DNA-binding NarL/FixJ family response regulator
MPFRLLIVDDHEIVRNGVRTLFANSDSIEVCGEAENGLEAIHLVPLLTPDVVILDLSMPGLNGFETVAKIRLIAPSVKIVIFSVHQIATTALWVGADAFVSKSSALQELPFTINRLLQLGETPQPQRKTPSVRAGS